MSTRFRWGMVFSGRGDDVLAGVSGGWPALFHLSLRQDSCTFCAAKAPMDQLPPGVNVASGAGRGLGRELVEQLRRQGRPLIAVVRRLEDCSLAPEGEALQLVEANLATSAGIEVAIAGILGLHPLGAAAHPPGGLRPRRALVCVRRHPAAPVAARGHRVFLPRALRNRNES